MTACVEFNGPRNLKGYGYAWVQEAGRKVLMHRWAYIQAHGLQLQDINGQVVRHTCDNPGCVNPAHLLLGSQADNVRDMIERRRDRKAVGVRNRATKLTAADVQDIRIRYIKGSAHSNLVTLGLEYAVAPSTIAAVIHREHHRSVE